jgi:hypothetical protein
MLVTEISTFWVPLIRLVKVNFKKIDTLLQMNWQKQYMLPTKTLPEK